MEYASIVVMNVMVIKNAMTDLTRIIVTVSVSMYIYTHTHTHYVY